MKIKNNWKFHYAYFKHNSDYFSYVAKNVPKQPIGAYKIIKIALFRKNEHNNLSKNYILHYTSLKYSKPWLIQI